MKKKDIIYIIYVFTLIVIAGYISYNFILKKSGYFVNLEETELPTNSSHCLDTSGERFELVQNCETIFDGNEVRISLTHIKINSHGFRDYEYSLEKPNNTFRIAVLGDSITFGWGVEIEDTYSKVLERKLKNELTDNDIKFEVLNFGVPGYNLWEKLEHLKEEAIVFDPDFIILQYFVNDLFNKTELDQIFEQLVKNYLKENNLDPDLSPSEINQSIMRKIEAKSYDIYTDDLAKKSLGIKRKMIDEPLEELSNITKEKNIKVAIFHIYGLDEFGLILSTKIKTLGWSYINLKPIFDRYDNSQWVICPEDTHPNKLGHKLIADSIYDFLIENKIIR